MWGGRVEAPIDPLLYTQHCHGNFTCPCVWPSERFTDELTWRLRLGALSPQMHSESVAEPGPHPTALSGLGGVTQTGHLWDLGPLARMLLNMETIACPLLAWPPPAPPMARAPGGTWKIGARWYDSRATDVGSGRPFPLVQGRIMASLRCPCPNPRTL